MSNVLDGKTKADLLVEVRKAHRRIADLERQVCNQTPPRQPLQALPNILQSILDSLDGLLVVIDSDYRVLLSNWKGHDFITEPERQGAPLCYKVFKRLDAPCPHCPPKDTITDGKPRVYEDRNPVDGSFKEISVTPLPDETGRVSTVMEYVRDITDRKRHDEELHRRESMLGATLESTADGILVVDHQGKVSKANQRFSEMWRIPPDLIRNMDDRLLLDFVLEQLVDPDDFLRRVCQLYASPDKDFDVLTFKDGRIFERFSSPLIEDGRITGRVWSFRDITETIRTNRELQAEKDKALAASRVKSEFLATMSHEIRTPLNGLLGMLQLLEMATLNKEQKDLVKTAMESGHMLLQILSDVLDISTDEAGKLHIAREPFELARTLQPVAASYMDLSAKKGVTFHYRVHQAVPDRLIGDPGRLRQVLFNLVGNAVKFTERGSVSVDVSTIRPVVPGRIRLLFTVSDTGIGIPDDKMTSIFMPFTQVDGSLSRKYSGTGLGLTLVERLVRHMNGSLAFDSTPGQGTTVCLGLELDLPEEHKTEAQPEEAMETPRILVVEDDMVNRLFLVRLLKLKGYQVSAVTDGKDVVSALSADRFDLVLMDVQMPTMSGLEATRRIREHDGSAFDPGLPVIALTAHAMEGDREHFLACGMDDYMGKPVGAQDLFAAIERLCPRAARFSS